MQALIEEAILRKARAILRVRRIEAATARKYADRYTKRTDVEGLVAQNADPNVWALHPHYDPRYCIRHAKYLSRLIWRRIKEGSYEPIPAIQYDIEKPGGGVREIMAFSIPDSALANVVHRRLTRRNINLFSSYSYAYRPDKNVFDAILQLNRSLKPPKSYVVQYDFKRYFDTITHSYLRNVLFEKKTFLISKAEKVVIGAFLEHKYSKYKLYADANFACRTVGVPQGSSLSLFLSNAAAHELDMELERQNGTFVRFADDVVAVTHSYTDAVQVSHQFRRHCENAGLKINYQKSPGIVLFTGGEEHEIRHYAIDDDDAHDLRREAVIDYLGHRLSENGVGLPDKSVKRIKKRISEIIYKHLFLHRRGDGGKFNKARVGENFVDWDLVTCINEIRSYIYGGLREKQLSAFLVDDVRPPFLRGLMAFFPLSTSGVQLQVLDGWLLNVIRRAQRERVKVVHSFGSYIPKLSEEQLVSGSWYDYAGIVNDMTLPSFVRGWRVSRKYYLRYGLADISPPSYYSLLNY